VPQELAAALRGVEAILLSPRAVGGATAELLKLAAHEGVQRVVVISSLTVQYPAGEQRFAMQFRAVEEAAQESGLAATLLRCADFDANALAWAPQIRAGGVVRGAYASAAVQALTSPENASRCHVLTGPQSLTQPGKVRLIGEATGRHLDFAEIGPEQVRQAMRAQGLPEEIPDRLLGSLRDYATEPGPTTSTVEELLGRPALTFAAWASQNSASFGP
jgi:uncharacterized protein YbjT (DUF2867 family)